MASNSFGYIFRITTWGESHGKAIGVVIDGCPAGLHLSESDINEALAKRAPGKSPYTSPRAEPDNAQLLSGVFDGMTTGAPISILIPNKDADSSKYDPIKDLLRPGHANYTYLEKYGVFDYRGGGRASARETVCRVAAGAIAKKLLGHAGINLAAYIKQIGNVVAAIESCPRTMDLDALHTATYENAVYCPDSAAAAAMSAVLDDAMKQGDSVGGVVEFIVTALPTGLGDPIYDKLEARLAYAMMSLPATKGFEIGSGFAAAIQRGSEHNDLFIQGASGVEMATNSAGGILAGISTGMPVVGRVAFKAPSSIMKPQNTLTTGGDPAVFQLPKGSRHDPCVAIRAVPVVEAMAALVLADALLLHRSARL